MKIRYLVYLSVGLISIIFSQDAGKYSPDDFANYQKPLRVWFFSSTVHIFQN